MVKVRDVIEAVEAEGWVYDLVYEQGPTSWGAYMENLPGCFSVGDTKEECERLIKEAIPLHLDALRRRQEEVVAPAGDATRA